MTRPARPQLVAGAAMLVAAVVVASCGSSSNSNKSGGQTQHMGASTMAMSHGSMTSTTMMGSMGGMDSSGSMNGTPMASGNGLATTQDGYRLALTMPAPAAASTPTLTFRIERPGGTAVTKFTTDQTKLLHFYAIRSDLTGFQHVHPTMASDGTWTAHLDPLVPGSWRVYASFIPDEGTGRGNAYVLSDTVSVLGTATVIKPPLAETPVAHVDGYTVTVSGRPKSGTTSPLTVRFTRAGKPVTDLQPYLDTYAHVSAFHAGDLAFTHLHPQGTVDGDHGGPMLDFEADLPRNGPWRLFIQFRTAGVLHTAAVTIHAT